MHRRIAADAGRQPLLMGVSWSRLDVRRASGLASDMIRHVSPIRTRIEELSFDRRTLALRRVLHLKMVTQCAMLEEFGIFLVLADKASFHDVIPKSYTHPVAVSLCLPYRSPCSKFTAYFTRFASASEIEWIQGCPLLPCRNSAQPDSGRLYEEERSTFDLNDGYCTLTL
jgi:hypothetical protein